MINKINKFLGLRDGIELRVYSVMYRILSVVFSISIEYFIFVCDYSFRRYYRYLFWFL